jgi:hypothetical protein
MLINKGWSAFKNNVLERVWDNRKKKKKNVFHIFQHRVFNLLKCFMQ